MIIKFFEKEKISKTGLDFYLIYGDNEGQKREVIENILKHFIICLFLVSCGFQ